MLTSAIALKVCALALWRALLAAALFAALMTPNWGAITLVGAIAGLILVADLANFGGGWSRYTGLSLAPRMAVNGTGFLLRGPWPSALTRPQRHTIPHCPKEQGFRS